MWKVVLLLLAVFVLGRFVVRYVRKSPLDPEVQGSEVVVQSQDDEVHLTRNGPVGGTYFVVDAKNENWTDQPADLRLQVLDKSSAADYLRSYPDFHLYRSESVARVAGSAMPLELVAADRETYGELRDLLGDHESRMSGGGERLCIRLSGQALSVASAKSLEDDTDRTSYVARLTADVPIVYVESADVDDCVQLLAAAKH